MSAQKNVNRNSLGAMKSSPAKQKGASAIEYVVIERWSPNLGHQYK